MRKQGEYICDKRLKFKKSLQRKFIRKIKEQSGLTWISLANKLNLSEHTLRVDWQKEKTTIPYKIVKKLLRNYPFEKFEKIKSNWVEEILSKHWGQKLAGGKNKKEINTPIKSRELAEIFGAILGDGYLGKKELVITGNVFEKKHHKYLNNIIKKLFGITCKLYISYTNKNTIILKVYSTELVNYLKNDGLVLGNKIKNKAILPKWIFNRKDFIYGALRGLFDTDGGIYKKQKNYKRAIIEFQTHSPHIRKDIRNLLLKGGFSASKSSGDIRIQNQNEINKFFRLVGSSNPKNIVRYIHFIKEGHIPLKENLNKEIINYKGKLPFLQL